LVPSVAALVAAVVQPLEEVLVAMVTEAAVPVVVAAGPSVLLAKVVLPEVATTGEAAVVTVVVVREVPTAEVAPGWQALGGLWRQCQFV